MSEEFKDNKKSENTNDSLVTSSVSDNFKHLCNLLNKKDFTKLRIKIDEVLSLNIDKQSTKIYAKLIELFLNLEENKLPSFVLLAPFGEVCENIKKLLDGNKVKDNDDINNVREILNLGKDLYNKFYENLVNLNEDNLLSLLKKYESIFTQFQIEDRVNLENNNVSKRTKEYLEEITLSKQFTNNKKRKRIFWCSLISIIVFGIIVICLNETFEFRIAKNIDFISLEKVDYTVNKPNPEVGIIKRHEIENKEIKDTIQPIAFNNKKSKKNIFSLGMYEIIKVAPVRIAPSKDAKVIGKFKIGNKIKVVGKSGKFYKIASKDNKSFGYVPIKFCKFVISDK